MAFRNRAGLILVTYKKPEWKYKCGGRNDSRFMANLIHYDSFVGGIRYSPADDRFHFLKLVFVDNTRFICVNEYTWNFMVEVADAVEEHYNNIELDRVDWKEYGF
jgi:hypothetical protein